MRGALGGFGVTSGDEGAGTAGGEGGTGGVGGVGGEGGGGAEGEGQRNMSQSWYSLSGPRFSPRHQFFERASEIGKTSHAA